MITNTQSGTNVHEVADGIYRINTPVAVPGGVGQFNFNQYLIVDDASMIFHTGPRQLFPLVREAVCSVLPIERLEFIGLSHFEADECGSLNSFLAAAPQSTPICSRVAAMVSIGDFADRAPRALADGEELALGRHRVRWFDTPHMPHSWECGLMLDVSTILERLARENPTTLACMHGSAWRGDGARLIRELSAALTRADQHPGHGA
jgi:hypothetical protein